MKKQNIFLKSIFVVASICTLTPNRVRANNDNLVVPAAIGIFVGGATYVALMEAFHDYKKQQEETLPTLAATFLEKFGVQTEQIRKENYIKNIAIPCLSVFIGLLGYSITR